VPIGARTVVVGKLPIVRNEVGHRAPVLPAYSAGAVHGRRTLSSIQARPPTGDILVGNLLEKGACLVFGGEPGRPPAPGFPGPVRRKAVGTRASILVEARLNARCRSISSTTSSPPSDGTELTALKRLQGQGRL